MTSPVTFVRETISELQKVAWPTRTEVIRLTVVVVVISLVVGLYIGGLDLAFAKAIEYLVK